MALSLNTGHALYSYLQNLICVDDDNVIKDLKNLGTTYTQDALAGGIIASAGYGRAFRVTKNGSYGAYVVTASTAINVDTTATGKTTVFIAFNTVDSVGQQGHVLGGVPFIQIKAAGNVTTYTAAGTTYGTNSTTTISLGAFASPVNNTVAVLRNGDTSSGGVVWINGAKDASSPLSNTSGQLGWSSGSHAITTIGNTGGNGSISADIVYIAIFKGYVPSDADISGLHSSLTGSNAFALIAAGDVTAPTLTSPGTSSVGSTTVTGNVTTDEANGTLYCLVTTNATETAATVKASGTTQSITTTGAKSINITGLTASTTYYAHFVHTDAAANNSTVSNSASFATTAGGGSVKTSAFYQTFIAGR